MQIRNEGTDTLSVSQVSSSNNQFSVESSVPFSITAGTPRDILVTFTPTSAGSQTATLSISSNDASSPTVSLLLTGTAVFKQVIYQTDFSQFAEGLNTIDGVDGWAAIHPGTGVQGTIDTTTLASNLGRSAFIGFRHAMF